VPVGNFWNKTLRIGPNPIEGSSGQWPDIEMYFLTVQCQHCADPECVKVCPTEASHITEDGTVQIDKSKCIGCQFCVMACPYNVRYLNQEEGVVEKCTLCKQKITQGELPQCVLQCGARARFFGDLDEGIDSFEAPWVVNVTEGPPTYEKMRQNRITLKECTHEYFESDIHHLPNVGNGPNLVYILRDRTWQGGDK
jgi:Fe-S-cluster-containing dehydrogenase component